MSENPKIRLMKRDELFKLKKLWKEQGSSLDPENLLTAAVAETEDERIIGVCGFELVPHLGPIYIQDGHRNQGIGSLLIGEIEKNLSQKPHTGYYTFPSNDASINLMKKLGLEKLPWEVWKREY